METHLVESFGTPLMRPQPPWRRVAFPKRGSEQQRRLRLAGNTRVDRHQGGTPSEALNTLISTDHVETLEKLHGRLTSCQVIVQVPSDITHEQPLQRQHPLALPGNIDVNIDHTSHDDERFSDPTFAVNDAFAGAKRQIKERARKQRGDVKKPPRTDRPHAGSSRRLRKRPAG